MLRDAIALCMQLMIQRCLRTPSNCYPYIFRCLDNILMCAQPMMMQRCESTNKTEQQPLPGGPLMSTPLEDMVPHHSPGGSGGLAQFGGHMAHHLSAGHISGLDGQLSAAHLPSHGSLQHMDAMAHHSGLHASTLHEPPMGSHMVISPCFHLLCDSRASA